MLLRLTALILFLLNTAHSLHAYVARDVEQLKTTNHCESCDLENANLSFVNLSYARLRGANLKNANLQSANLERADLSQVRLEGADLSRARWVDGRRCKTGSIGTCILD